MNHAAGIKGNYKILQKDLTGLKAGQKSGRCNAVLVQAQVQTGVCRSHISTHNRYLGVHVDSAVKISASA